MKAPREHARFLGNFVPISERPAEWSQSSWDRLIRFGGWYDALVSGSIEPLSDLQREFRSLFRQEVEREPQNDDERLSDAYLKLEENVRAKKMSKISTRSSGLSHGVHNTNASRRLPNGDDKTIYFIRRRRS